MRIAFDATTLQGHQTGIGYYTEHLLHQLLEVGGDHEIFLLSNRSVKTSRPLSKKLERLGIGFPLRSVWMQSAAPWSLLRSRPSVAHFTNSIMPLVCPAPAVLTVHDMSLHLYPQYHPLRRRLTRPLVTASLGRARAVITVSEAARRDILKLVEIPSQRVHVVHEAPAPQFRALKKEDTEAVRQKHELPGRFLLFVGAIEPRKNLVRLIDAFARLRRRGLPHGLVLVGPHFWGFREVASHIFKLGLEKEVLLPGYWPFELLPALYNLAEAFLFPSLYEGFGLPVVEAMACGLPVLTSRDSAMAEVAGDAALLVDPRDIESIERGIECLLDEEESKRRRRLSLLRAAEFSWARAARETLRIYETVAEH